MLLIRKQFEFHAAHHLPDHEGKCKQVHGHGYVLEVEITGPIQSEGSENGMIMDFGKLKEIVNETIIDALDHTDLNFTWKHPTAENMVQDMAHWLDITLPSPISLTRLSLWETRTSCAIWRRS